MPNPKLITFDIFGTVVDWKSGLEQACAAEGRPLKPGEFDRIVDAQGAFERAEFHSYTIVTEQSVRDVLGLPNDAARRVASTIGSWPLFPDSREALRALLKLAPCAAMTNSDRIHGDQIQAQLGFKLSDWLCAESVKVYKPHAKFWQLMSERRGVAPGADWWHVSAYADYDLSVANHLGLTTVFVQRPHHRPGEASHHVKDLGEIPSLL